MTGICTINGIEAINDSLTIAMAVTIARLVEEGVISDEQASAFLDTHICVLVKESGFKSWLNRVMGRESPSIVRCVHINK